MVLPALDHIYFQITMPAKLLACLLLLFAAQAQISITSVPQPSALSLPSLLPCVAFQNAECITCPFNYHITQDQCFLNITHCLSYQLNSPGLVVCKQCDTSRARSNNQGGCTARPTLLTTSSVSVREVLEAEQAASNYGDNRFVVMQLRVMLNDPYLQLVNNYMLAGEYRHFIRRVTQPVVSVAYFAVGGQYQYKILYNGSGGGLMMCIITLVTTTLAIQINSFVPIGVTNVIDNCGQYDLSLACLQCITGWHLEGSLCYINIDACLTYSQDICLSCDGFNILIENRCVACSQMSDLNKVVFYRGDLTNYINSQTQPAIRFDYLLA